MIYLFQIAFEIMWLPILINLTNFSRKVTEISWENLYVDIIGT